MTRRLRIEDLAELSAAEQPALSPDGGRIAYVLRSIDLDGDRTVRSIWVVGSRRGRPRQLTRGTSDFSPAYSPDGKQIAFLRAQDGPAQIWVLPAAGGEAEQLTSLPLGAGAPKWSPDSSKMAFAAPVDLRAEPAEEDEARERRARAPIASERLDYQADGTGLLGSMRMHLHVLELDGGDCRQVTSGDWHAGDPSWSPDGERLAFAAATDPEADLAFHAPVHLVDAGGVGARPEVVALADGVARSVSFVPDGSALLVAGFLGEPVGHVRLYRVPLDGGDAVELAPELDRNVMVGGPAYPGAPPQVARDGRTVFFCARESGCTHLYAVPLRGGKARPVLSGEGRVVVGVSCGGDSAAVALETQTSFGEIVHVDLATRAEAVRTDAGARLADVELFPREPREFRISDGTVVHGWLVRDPERDGPRPLLVDVHGGPHNAFNSAVDEIRLYHQELAVRGWVVLLVNPRGSDGYGEEFYNGARAAWGEADAKDFLEPIDALVAEGLADPDRLAVTGYSYGGYMTCYLTSRDKRFAAAVAGGVVSDLVSMAGTSDTGRYMSEYELRADPWPARRYDAMSPFSRVSRVETPTLIYQGADDLRCPLGQAQQWYAALRARGVPTKLVLYPEASHLFILEGRPSHRIDFNRQVVDWVEQYAAGRRARIDPAHWQRRLGELAARHNVPAAALGILRVHPDGEDEVMEVAYGLLNREDSIEATPDSVFQIGSMTKVWTATVVMQLVDEGKLDLDAPLVEVLPELELADAAAKQRVTMRHLLTHTSGIDGDIFTDTGRGDDCLERYVAGLAGAAQNHPLGATWSYCNSGFSLAGRVIEKLTEGSWDRAIRERLIAPLGLTRTSTLPEEAILHRTAVGHVGKDLARAPVWVLPRALGPAGLINSTVGDVLAFARMHLTGGLAADGSRVLSEASATAMTKEEAELPDKYILGDSWGLGWIRFGWDGRRLIGHDGNTVGQSAVLRVLPDEGLAVTLLMNGGNTRDLYQDLYPEIFAELAGVEMPTPLGPPPEPVSADVTPHLGTYERESVRIDVLPGDGQPVLRTTVTGPLAEIADEPTHDYPMVAVEENLYVIRDPEAETWAPVTFYALPGGKRYLHFGARATPKVL